MSKKKSDVEEKEVKSEKIEKKTKEVKDVNKPKKKKTTYEKNKVIMKIVAWIMVLVMIFGVIMSFLVYFI